MNRAESNVAAATPPSLMRVFPPVAFIFYDYEHRSTGPVRFYGRAKPCQAAADDDNVLLFIPFDQKKTDQQASWFVVEMEKTQPHIFHGRKMFFIEGEKPETVFQSDTADENILDFRMLVTLLYLFP